MIDLVRIFLRSFTIVTLTAINVVQITHGRYGLAFAGGALINYVWWGNAGTAVKPHHQAVAHLTYALGGACGTVFGMWVAGYLSRI